MIPVLTSAVRVASCRAFTLVTSVLIKANCAAMDAKAFFTAVMSAVSEVVALAAGAVIAARVVEADPPVLSVTAACV